MNGIEDEGGGVLGFWGLIELGCVEVGEWRYRRVGVDGELIVGKKL